jgi:hypothetical protein
VLLAHAGKLHPRPAVCNAAICVSEHRYGCECGEITGVVCWGEGPFTLVAWSPPDGGATRWLVLCGECADGVTDSMPEQARAVEACGTG